MNISPWNAPKSAPGFPESGADFAESAHPPKSGIWLFLSCFNDLKRTFQISEMTFRNLLGNLEFACRFNGLEQFSDFGFSSLTGRCHPPEPGVAPVPKPAWWDDG